MLALQYSRSHASGTLAYMVEHWPEKPGERIQVLQVPLAEMLEIVSGQPHKLEIVRCEYGFRHHLRSSMKLDTLINQLANMRNRFGNTDVLMDAGYAWLDINKTAVEYDEDDPQNLIIILESK